MNEAHLHVALNHFPVVGAVIAAGILITGLVWKNVSIQKTSLWLFIFIALLAIPVLLTGEGAKEIVEHLPAVDEEVIEKHEQFATISFWLLIITGLFSMVQLFILKRWNTTSKFTLLIALLAITASGMAGLTANAGGKIRHTEFATSPANEETEIKAIENDEPVNEKDKGRGRKRKGRDR